MQEVLISAQEVAGHSRHVSIDENALEAFAAKLCALAETPPPWDGDVHYSGPAEHTAFYLLVLDTVNFCFWPPAGKPRWRFSRKGRTLSGYDGLAFALKTALFERIPITCADFLATLTREEFLRIVGREGHLQLVDERVAALRELGRFLTRRCGGQALELVAQARGSAVALARILAQNLFSFRDSALHRGKAVHFYKRAQIVASDLAGAFKGKGPGDFKDADELTCFADYKLPQVLRHAGVIGYSEALARKVDRMEHLPPGSEEEVEIRANTIWAVEKLRLALLRKGISRQARELDTLLWLLGQDEAYRQKPYHRTAGIFY